MIKNATTIPINLIQHKNVQLMKYLIFEHVVDQILSISAMQKYEHTHTHQVVEVNEYR